MLTQTVAIKPDVLVQDLGGEIVLLDLDSERYFGLDDIGSVMWSTLKEVGSLQTTYDRLLDRYDVEPEALKQDLLELVDRFVEHGLVEVVNS